MVIYMSKLVTVEQQPRNCGKLDYAYGLYSSVARQQGTPLVRAFPYGVLGQVLYLNVSISDLCIFPYFKHTVLKYRIYLKK